MTHPHAGKWAEVFALVKDGLAFSRGGEKAAGHFTANFYRGGRVGMAVVASKKASTREKREKKEGGRKNNSSTKGKDSKQKKEALVEPLAGQTVAHATAPAAAEGTAAGGGGRWVHVPE